jgi:hypothetical protein
MRSLLRFALPALAAASLASQGVVAQDVCPKQWNSSILERLGAPVATSRIWTLYRPEGLSALGQRVPYVVLERDTTVWTLYYRLGDQVKVEGGGLAPPVSKAYLGAFQGAQCNDERCWFGPTGGMGRRWLMSGGVQGVSPPGRGLAGPAWSAVLRDQALWEKSRSALGLRCLYAAAPVLSGGQASEATKASSPERWGLDGTDLSMLHNEALMQKPGLPARRPELDRAAQQGDAYAQWLAALRPDGQDDDMTLLRKAAAQGLVRAAVDVHTSDGMRGVGGGEHLQYVRARAEEGNAHATLYLAYLIARPEGRVAVGGEAERWLLRSAEAGYAPAQHAAGMLKATIGTRKAWAEGRAWLQKAAKQGYRPARDAMAAYPPEPRA